jgi:hypothetical protein
MACNKNAPPPSTSNQVENGGQTDLRELKQQLYMLSSEKCTPLIVSFKDFAHAQNLQSKVESSTLAADSSIWLLEAALNYDFDQAPTSNTLSDSCSYEIDLLGPNSVNSNDMVNAYNYFYGYISQNVNSQKQVKVIDLMGYVNGNKLIYRAHIVYFIPTEAKVMGPCDSYTSGGGYWNACTSPDAIPLTEVKLNCTAYDPGCSGSWYWTSIINTPFSNQNGAYSSSLYYVASTTNTCPWLTYTTINGYITGCRNLGTSNHPGGSYILIDYDISWGTIWLGGFNYKQWWDLIISYGIPQCNQGGGGGRLAH